MINEARHPNFCRIIPGQTLCRSSLNITTYRIAEIPMMGFCAIINCNCHASRSRSAEGPRLVRVVYGSSTRKASKNARWRLGYIHVYVHVPQHICSVITVMPCIAILPAQATVQLAVYTLDRYMYLLSSPPPQVPRLTGILATGDSRREQGV